MEFVIWLAACVLLVSVLTIIRIIRELYNIVRWKIYKWKMKQLNKVTDVKNRRN